MSTPKTEFKFDLRHWLVGVNWDTTASPDGQTYFVAIHFGPLFWIRCWNESTSSENMSASKSKADHGGL